jgi:lipopolysaccharide transport system ATP-binding protein
MCETVIKVENISKRYWIGHLSRRKQGHRTLRDVLVSQAREIAHKTADLVKGRQIVQGDQVEEFWALKNVSFEVRQGDVLGIIGRNGAGKSTLLKILSRIVEPTEGRVVVRGRVASLLEVGTGFHPELTGRENIFLNGAILGMTRGEILRKFDEIVAFAEVERFIDTPTKRYSSGMYVRLAFAVAAHLEPEILVVDEVLAVGDAQFQKKCLGKMDEISSRQGKTVIFVSHNMGTLLSLCPHAVWLNAGSVHQQGVARDVIGSYLSDRQPNREKLVQLSQLPREYVDDEDRLRLECIEWLSGLPLQHGEPIRARIQFKTQSPLVDVAVTIGFSNFEGRRLISYDSDLRQGARHSLSRAGTYSVLVEVDSLCLAPDTYNLDLVCRSGDSCNLDCIPAAMRMEIVSGPTTPGYLFRSSGGVRAASKWLWHDQIKNSSQVI